MSLPLLSVRDLTVEIASDRARFKAVDGLSFDVPRGKTVALVGESGSGKSVTAQAIMRILPKVARIAGGRILFDDPARPAAAARHRGARRRRASAMRAAARRPHRHDLPGADDLAVAAPHGRRPGHAKRCAPRDGRATREAQGAGRRGVPRGSASPTRSARSSTYPFELSGGLRQRAMIAMALITRPALLIADEPTTALDVTTQAQILDLIRELQAETGMSVLLITHDLGVVANMADDVVVMYRGRVMEAGDAGGHLPPPAAPLSEGADAGGAALRHGAGRAPDAAPRGQERRRRARRPASRSSAAATGSCSTSEASRRASRCGPGWFSGKHAHDPGGQRRQPRRCPAARRWASSANPAAARPRCRR